MCVRDTTRWWLWCQVWAVSRPGEGGQWLEVELTDPAKVNLYDLDTWVIRSCAPLLLAAAARRSHLHACATRPATKGRQCSLVEVMATGPQPPDYFVSHWWPLSVCPRVLLR